jgi:hypothetical protein
VAGSAPQFSGKAARAAEAPRQLCLERAILHNRSCGVGLTLRLRKNTGLLPWGLQHLIIGGQLPRLWNSLRKNSFRLQILASGAKARTCFRHLLARVNSCPPQYGTSAGVFQLALEVLRQPKSIRSAASLSCAFLFLHV